MVADSGNLPLIQAVGSEDPTAHKIFIQINRRLPLWKRPTGAHYKSRIIRVNYSKHYVVGRHSLIGSIEDMFFRLGSSTVRRPFSNAMYKINLFGYWVIIISLGLLCSTGAGAEIFEREAMPEAGVKWGLIAPLTGRYAVYGEAVLQGVKLALQEKKERSGSAPTLLIKDSRGRSSQAVRHLQEMSFDSQVVAVLGPVLSRTVLAAGKAASELGLPMVNPSASSERLPDLGPYVFHVGVTALHQVQTLARFVIEKMYFREFAILYPRNLYGRELAADFAAQIDKLGGRIVWQESYDDKAVDFRQQIETLSRLEPEAIFIPDYYDKVALIAPQITYYLTDLCQLDPEEIILEDRVLETLLAEQEKEETEREPAEEGSNSKTQPDSLRQKKGKQTDNETSLSILSAAILEYLGQPVQTNLLGANGWSSPELVKQGGTSINNAVFTSSLFWGTEFPLTRDFIERFKDRFAQEPTLLAAQAYDATWMLMWAITTGGPTREGVRTALRRLKNFPGVTGFISITPDGGTEKTVAVLGVRSRRVKELKGAERWLYRARWWRMQKNSPVQYF